VGKHNCRGANQPSNITNGDVGRLARCLAGVRATLCPTSLAELLGESHHYADILLRMDADAITRPTLLSTIKLRQAGFAECGDSDDVIRDWIPVLRDRRLIPAR
jgi:hypothetical protein